MWTVFFQWVPHIAQWIFCAYHPSSWVRIPSTPHSIHCQILYYICVNKGTKINKKRSGLAHLKNIFLCFETSTSTLSIFEQIELKRCKLNVSLKLVMLLLSWHCQTMMYQQLLSERTTRPVVDGIRYGHVTLAKLH